MGRKDILVSVGLPKEKIENIRFLYIVIDSDLKVHYEFNNKGHIVLPIHFNELNPFMIYKNLPHNLVRRCVSPKKNIVGILQLWIYYTKDYSYGRVRALGLLNTFKGNRIKALFKLMQAMDNFCKGYNIKFTEAETAVIPERVMKKAGFFPAPSKKWGHRFAQYLSRMTPYVKKYS